MKQNKKDTKTLPSGLPTGMYADVQRNYVSFEREPIAGTPFNLLYLEEKGWTIALGNVQLNMPKETKEEALKPLEGIDWQFMTVAIGAIVEVIVAQQQREMAESLIKKVKEEEEIIN